MFTLIFQSQVRAFSAVFCFRWMSFLLATGNTGPHAGYRRQAPGQKTAAPAIHAISDRFWKPMKPTSHDGTSPLAAKATKTSADKDKLADASPPLAQARSSAAEASGTADKASAAPASQTAKTWPFPAGSQGDNKPLPSKPVQRAGWNARQFRI